jgi:hypothetical protein
MSDQPQPVTSAEISDLLAAVSERFHRSDPITPSEDVAFLERKADVMGRIATAMDDPDAAGVAAAARAQLDAARARLAGGEA